MSNYYAPCFYRIDFVVIPCYIELSWLYHAKTLTECLLLRFWTLSCLLDAKMVAKVIITLPNIFIVIAAMSSKLSLF